MRTAVELREQIAALKDECESIQAVADREGRDLNEEESARVEAILQDQVPTLNKKLKTANLLEKERLERATSRIEAERTIEANQAQQLVSGVHSSSGDRWASLRIPVRNSVHGPLKAFKGEEAARDAYICGQWALANLYGSRKAMQFCEQHGIMGAMTSKDNSSAGFLIPEEMSAAIVRNRETMGVFPQFANRFPMGSDVTNIARILADVTATWVGESIETDSGEPTIGQAKLVADKLMSMTRIPTEVDEDAIIDVGDMIVQSMAYASALKIDQAAFLGDGGNSYGGVVGLVNALHANAVVDAATGNDSAKTLDLEDFENVIGAVPDYPGMNGRWYMSKPVYYASAHRLMTAAGGNTTVTLANGVVEPMFLGYPVTFVNVMPKTTGTLASTIVAYFGDLRLAATYGVRRSQRTQVSAERYFELDQIAVKMTERLAMLVHETGDTDKTRPIVALKTAA